MRRVWRWWANPRLPMRTVSWLRLSWLLLAGSAVGWPLSAVTIAAGEPQVVLFLSWAAIFIGALGNVIAAEVRARQDD